MTWIRGAEKQIFKPADASSFLHSESFVENPPLRHVRSRTAALVSHSAKYVMFRPSFFREWRDARGVDRVFRQSLRARSTAWRSHALCLGYCTAGTCPVSGGKTVGPRSRSRSTSCVSYLPGSKHPRQVKHHKCDCSSDDDP